MENKKKERALGSLFFIELERLKLPWIFRIH